MTNILVVEDDPSIRLGLVDTLTAKGYDVVAVARGGEGAERAISGKFDLVVLDVMLPDIDGFDVLLKMRQHAALKTVPVIMVTSKATREAVLTGLARGADGYLTKPVEPDTLKKAIRAVLGADAGSTKGCVG